MGRRERKAGRPWLGIGLGDKQAKRKHWTPLKLVAIGGGSLAPSMVSPSNVQGRLFRWCLGAPPLSQVTAGGWKGRLGGAYMLSKGVVRGGPT